MCPATNALPGQRLGDVARMVKGAYGNSWRFFEDLLKCLTPRVFWLASCTPSSTALLSCCDLRLPDCYF